MRSLRVLKSVAHSVGHHFASSVNYWEGDYAVNHLWRISRDLGQQRVQIDLFKNSLLPIGFQNNVTLMIVDDLRRFLNQLMIKLDIDVNVITSLTLEYYFHDQRQAAHWASPVYDCTVILRAMNGKTYRADLTEQDN